MRTVRVDATGIYWVSAFRGPGKVMHATLDGTKTKVIAGVPDVGGLAIDEKNVYWTAGKSIFRAAKPHGPARLVTSGRRNILNLTVDEASLFWSEGEPGKLYDIRSADKLRPVPKTLAPQEDVGIDGLQVASGSVFWLAKNRLRSVSISGGSPRNVVEADVDAFVSTESVLAVSSKKYLWSGQPDKPSNLVATSGEWLPDYVIQVSDNHFYGSENGWSMKGSHPARLWRMTASGGCAELIATFRPTYFNDFALFNGAVYWGDREQGGIFRVTP